MNKSMLALVTATALLGQALVCHAAERGSLAGCRGRGDAHAASARAAVTRANAVDHPRGSRTTVMTPFAHPHCSITRR